MRQGDQRRGRAHGIGPGRRRPPAQERATRIAAFRDDRRHAARTSGAHRFDPPDPARDARRRALLHAPRLRRAASPEIETDANNFDALNIPPDHPAREGLDSFYLRPDLVLRTHTSPMQVRAMRESGPPIAIIVPAKRTAATRSMHGISTSSIKSKV